MGFLRRLRGAADKPDWSPFPDGHTHKAFEAAVEADLHRRGWAYELVDAMVLVSGDDPEPHQYGLSNLAQICALEERDRWGLLIANHFDSVSKIRSRDLDALAADYDQARRVLGTRLMPDELLGRPELENAVTRRIAPGILAVLVFDFPDSTATVHRDHVQGWPVDIESLFVESLEILDREPKPLREDVQKEDRAFTAWYGDGFYVASWLMRADELLPPGTVDAIVAVPNRHTFLGHPVTSGAAVPSMVGMQELATDWFQAGPGSISPWIYWWHAGALEVIDCRINGRSVELHLPEGLNDVLERIATAPPTESAGT